MVEKKFNCRKCKKIIGGHNQYLHDGMCDDCFFEEYFPEPNYEKARKEIERQKVFLKEELQEFLGKNEIFFERKFGLQKFFEILAIEHKKSKQFLLEFLKQAETQNLFLFTLYDGFITNVLETNEKDIDEKFLSTKIIKENEDSYITYSLTDLQSFYLVFGEGIIFLSSNQRMSEACENLTKELKLEYTAQETRDFDGMSENMPS